MTNPMTPSFQPKRRRHQTAQSLTVAIIVLFLLLFLGGLFIAMIANSLRSTKKSAEGSAADKLAEAGIHYLDDQLTKSPEGADWRPVPYVADPADTDNTSGGGNYDDQDSNGNGLRNAEPLRTNDPDYVWLRPCREADGLTNHLPDACGYSRADFGGRTASAGNLGGRALVKVDYDPAPSVLTPTSHFIHLLSVGRSGIVDASDPTTFANSEGKGARREWEAYKQLGLVDYGRLVTNKDNRSVVAALGTMSKSLDSPFAAGSRPATAGEAREIESVYQGPIHSNAPLTFYGVNRVMLNPARGEALTVSAGLSLNGVSDQAAAVGATDPSRVYLTDLASVTTTQIFPSSSTGFTSLNGLLRDDVPQSNDPLRRVAKMTVPLMDQVIGDNGVTRYKALTRESEPMDPRYLGPTVGNPPEDPATLDPGLTTPPFRAGRLGWGSGLYLDNNEDSQQASDGLIGAYSPRANWLGADKRWWNGDSRYVPPAVVITLTPRYMIIQRSATSLNRSFLRDKNGRRINQTTEIRYSGQGNGIAETPPSAGLPGTVRKLQGYPADPEGTPNIWKSDYVVYAEGNIRIRGTVGGLDPETLRYYIRHLTVVSGGNIYIDGNLLKDNIPDDAVGTAAQVKGRSSIALLAKNYVVLNTTQFLAPSDNLAEPEVSGSDTLAVFLKAGTPNFSMRLNQGPIQFYNANGTASANANGTPLRLAPSDPIMTPHLMVRHSAAQENGATAVRLGVNADQSLATPFGFFRFPIDMAWPNSNPGLTTLALGGPTSMEPGVYFDHVFALKDGGNNPALLYPDHTVPFAGVPPFGIDNQLTLALDTSAGVPNQTDYRLSRFGVAPLDVRVEALIYAQEGSFFIIPGPWFNPDPNDTYEAFLSRGNVRAGDNITSGRPRIDPMYPFYGQAQDIRITMCGAIAENLPAEVGDQGAWLEKWGWVPHYYGSTGLPPAPGSGYADPGPARYTVHGPNADTVHGVTKGLPGPKPGGSGGGSGIIYLYDRTLVSPVDGNGNALRQDLFGNILPVAPRLPVAPGLLYVGEKREA